VFPLVAALLACPQARSASWRPTTHCPSSDGTEKVTVPESATVGELRALLESQFAVPDADQTLSLDPKLVRAYAVL
jgi:hypothetical protein